MSTTKNVVARPLRIIALPLKRQPPSSNSSTPTILTYYRFQVHTREKKEPTDKIMQYVKTAQTKATETWAAFGRAEEGSWKKRLHVFGIKLAERIDFEELALHTVDPSLGPSLSHPASGVRLEKQVGEIEKINMETPSAQTLPASIPLLYPSRLTRTLSSSAAPYSPLDTLRKLLAHRTPRHLKGFRIWLVITPLTIPFAILPVIPNLPFFYAAWRTWSHWRAYKASAYLQSLVDSGSITPQANDTIDEIYVRYSPILSASKNYSSDHTRSTDASNPSEETVTDQQMLLIREAVPALVSALELTDTDSLDIKRALVQAEARK